MLNNFDFSPEAVVLGGGEFPTHEIPLSLIECTDRLVCCDGAVNQCTTLNLKPWRVVGDGDSISSEARQRYAACIRTFPDQETNDQTKAIMYLKKKGIRHIAIVGATGRREDHTLGNISLLIEYLKDDLDVRIYTDSGVFIACKDDAYFSCPKGTAVSVFGFGTTGMQSQGLAYQLYDFTTWWQGTLNHTIEDEFSIRCKGMYLVYMAYKNEKLRK